MDFQNQNYITGTIISKNNKHKNINIILNIKNNEDRIVASLDLDNQLSSSLNNFKKEIIKKFDNLITKNNAVDVARTVKNIIGHDADIFFYLGSQQLKMFVSKNEKEIIVHNVS